MKHNILIFRIIVGIELINKYILTLTKNVYGNTVTFTVYIVMLLENVTFNKCPVFEQSIRIFHVSVNIIINITTINQFLVKIIVQNIWHCCICTFRYLLTSHHFDGFLFIEFFFYLKKYYHIFCL